MPVNVFEDDVAYLPDLERDDEVISISDSENHNDSSFALKNNTVDYYDGFDDDDDDILASSFRSRETATA